jgi:hypothetical protein
MDARIGDEVRLKFGDIHVQSTIETERSSEGRNDLGDETVEVGVGRTLNVEVATAYIVKRLVVKAKGAVGVLQKGMGRKDGVVRLNDSSGNHRRWRDSEGELRLASVVDRETLQKEGSKTRTSSTTSSMEDEESLKTSAAISKLANAIKDRINNLLSSSVVTTGIVVSSVLLPANDLFRMIKSTVRAVANSITDRRLQIDKDGTWDVLSRTRLAEKGGKGIVRTRRSDALLQRAVRVNAVLQAVQLPAVVSDLDTSLTQMNTDALCRGYSETNL